MITLELPWPPSINHYKSIGSVTRTKSGKVFQKRINSKATIAFFHEVYTLTRQRSIPAALDETLRLSVTVELYPPDRRKRDIDNPVKVLLDSLVHARVIADDSQIDKLLIERMAICDKGKVIVRIYILDQIL